MFQPTVADAVPSLPPLPAPHPPQAESTAVPTLRIALFGDFSLSYDEQRVTTLATPRLQSLFAYLVLHRDIPQPRQHLAFLFWPDAHEAQARNNLRQVVHQLRHALPAVEHFLQVDASTLCWHPDAPFSLDVADFEHALDLANAAEVRGDQQALHAALEEADRLYRADLLPSCYDEWIMPERERLRQRHLQALERLVRLLEARGDTGTAIDYARRLVRADPLAEVAYRSLMRLLALDGDRAGALRVYHTCVATLQRELGVEPDPATRAAYEQLLRSEVPTAPVVVREPALAATPTLLGRQREWGALQAAWQRAAAGEPHFVLVTGEAGVGKSRLAEDLLAWASQQGIVTAKARSYAAEGQLSLAPVATWFRSDGLRPHLARLDAVWLTEIARILPELLATRPELPRYEVLPEFGQRQRFFEALARAALATPQPLLLVIDDLQWCDQETLDWLHYLLRFDPQARLLVVGSARAEELPAHHPLRALLLHLRSTTGVTEIALQPLDAADTAKLAAQVAGHALDLDAATDLFHETEGNPLFVVETVRAGLGQISAAERLPRRALSASAQPLPPRVHAVLAGRLLQLSEQARAYAELGATIGREFTLDLLTTAGNADADSAVRALDELWHKRIVREHGANSYDFTHDKLREVAYAEISAPQRHLLHRRIAQALEALHAEDLDSYRGQIASHFERAGLVERAIPHYRQAATVAQRVYANDDALAMLGRGLALVEGLPASAKRDAQELGLQLALAVLYRVMKGWTAPELERALDRALALGDKVGDDEQRVQMLHGLQALYVVQAKFERVTQLSEEIEVAYQRSHGIAPPPISGMMVVGAQLHLGRAVEANDGFGRMIAAHDPQHNEHLGESQGWHFVEHAQAWQAHALWCLGYPRTALACGLDAVQRARDAARPFNHALAATYRAMLQQLCADNTTAMSSAEAALALAVEHRAPYYRTWSAILVRYALAWEQPDAIQIAQLRAAITEFKAAGARLRLPYYLGLLAQVNTKAGQTTEGLVVIDEALAEARAHGEHWWDAELHRLRGELLLAHGAEVSDAEAALFRAVTIARGQQARSLELRATTSLARLWATRQRTDEARRMLGALYAWFTEGFETPDLQEARAMLAHLT